MFKSKSARFCMLVVTCLALCAGTAGTPAAARPGVAIATAENTPEERMAREINRVRAAHGLRRLEVSPPLGSASRRYARSIVATGRFRHARQLRPPGFMGVGEVLERHYDGRERVSRTVRHWMRSPSHRRVLLDPVHREGGAGLLHGRLHGAPVSVWVVRLGHR